MYVMFIKNTYFKRDLVIISSITYPVTKPELLYLMEVPKVLGLICNLPLLTIHDGLCCP